MKDVAAIVGGSQVSTNIFVFIRLVTPTNAE